MNTRILCTLGARIEPWALEGPLPWALAGPLPWALKGLPPRALEGPFPWALEGPRPWALLGAPTNIKSIVSTCKLFLFNPIA